MQDAGYILTAYSMDWSSIVRVKNITLSSTNNFGSLGHKFEMETELFVIHYNATHSLDNRFSFNNLFITLTLFMFINVYTLSIIANNGQYLFENITNILSLLNINLATLIQNLHIFI